MHQRTLLLIGKRLEKGGNYWQTIYPVKMQYQLCKGLFQLNNKQVNNFIKMMDYLNRYFFKNENCHQLCGEMCNIFSF